MEQEEATIAKQVLERRLQRLHAAVNALVVDSSEIIATIDESTPQPSEHAVLPLTTDDDEALHRLIANNALSKEEKMLLNARNKTRDADAFGAVAPWLSATRVNDEVASMQKCEVNSTATATTQSEPATARVTRSGTGSPMADTEGAVGRVRSLSAETRAHMSTIAGKKESIISSPARVAVEALLEDTFELTEGHEVPGLYCISGGTERPIRVVVRPSDAVAGELDEAEDARGREERMQRENHLVPVVCRAFHLRI